LANTFFKNEFTDQLNPKLSKQRNQQKQTCQAIKFLIKEESLAAGNLG
jgi:hypothetical protein